MAKETIIEMKRELTIWANMFANDTLDMGFISKIYKELIRLNSKKKNNPIKKSQRTWIDPSSRRSYRGPIDIWKDAQRQKQKVQTQGRVITPGCYENTVCWRASEVRPAHVWNILASVRSHTKGFLNVMPFSNFSKDRKRTLFGRREFQKEIKIFHSSVLDLKTKQNPAVEICTCSEG